MTKKTHLWLEEPAFSKGDIISSATIEWPGAQKQRIWIKLPINYSRFITPMADPFVLLGLFGAMHNRTDMFVHGQVSPLLLRNLQEFQTAWSQWRPQRYCHIEIKAELEREWQYEIDKDYSIAAFSGGVDSCFTVWQHRMGLCGRAGRNLRAGVMVHGFDIPLARKVDYNRAADKAEKMLNSVDVELIRAATNFRQIYTDYDWEDICGTTIAASLMLCNKRYRCGLIASTLPFNNLISPCGSNPLTDRLMSSGSFEVIHDGTTHTRTQKIKAISDWPAAMKYLRVCWQGRLMDRNCCECEKCVRTILHFRSLGLAVPECFAKDVTSEQIRNIGSCPRIQMSFLRQIITTARENNIHEPWVDLLEKNVRRKESYNQQRGFLMSSLARPWKFARRLKNFMGHGKYVGQ